MNPIKAPKGYDKVNYIEDQNTPKKPQNNKSIFLLIFTIFISGVLLIIIGTTLIHIATSKSRVLSKSDSISIVCNSTRYPESCISTLQNATITDPEYLFQLTLQATLNELTNLSSLPKELLLKATDPRVKTALSDCQSLVGDTIDSVNQSIDEMKVGADEKMLSEKKINDINTWLSAALTNLDTCVESIDEMDPSLHEEMEMKMKNAKQGMSNSLAIIAHMEPLLHQLHMTMH